MLDYAETVTAERVKRVIDDYGEGDKAVAGTGGGFGYYELGEPLMIGDVLNENLPVEKIRESVWFMETRGACRPEKPETPEKPESPAGQAATIIDAAIAQATAYETEVNNSSDDLHELGAFNVKNQHIQPQLAAKAADIDFNPGLTGAMKIDISESGDVTPKCKSLSKADLNFLTSQLAGKTGAERLGNSTLSA